MFRSTLFSHQMRLPGWIILIAGVILGSAYVFFEYELAFLDMRVPAIGGGFNWLSFESKTGWIRWIENNTTNEIAAFFSLVGIMLVAFSKEVVEDEFYDRLRFEAMVWALKIQVIFLLLGVVFFYDFVFLRFMMIALFSFFFLYIGRYHYMLYKYRKESA